MPPDAGEKAGDDLGLGLKRLKYKKADNCWHRSQKVSWFCFADHFLFITGLDELAGLICFPCNGNFKTDVRPGNSNAGLNARWQVDSDETVFTNMCIQIYMHQIYFFISCC